MPSTSAPSSPPADFLSREQQRLPSPYQAEAPLVRAALDGLAGALDWAAGAEVAAPWVQAVRRQPPPFWAMESLLKEYPISSAEGLALMRLAEALLRVPDAETAIALTADQLGRADFEAVGDGALARLSASAIALSKKFLPASAPTAAAGDKPGNGLMGKLGARAVVAATLRAVQLLGRQFVLGQTIGDALDEAEAARQQRAGLRFSYDMLGEGARTAPDAARYLLSYEQAIQAMASRADRGAGVEDRDGISIKLSALHPRYEASQRGRVLAELVPRVWGLCELAARADINLTIDAEEVDRLELSLDVFEALAARVAQQQPQWQGFGLALQAYQTRAVALVDEVIALARRYRIRLMCRLVKGAYWDAEIKRAQELGLAHYPVFTHKHHTDISYLACARALLAAPDAVYPQFAGHNAGSIAAILQMARTAPAASGDSAPGARFELQRLHGMGEGVFREVLKDPAVRCRIYAPVGAHRDLLAYLVRRLLENGANSSFVHQLADESLDLAELLQSPLWLASASSLPLPPDLFGGAGVVGVVGAEVDGVRAAPGAGRANSLGLDLAVLDMRAPLLAALASSQVPQLAQAEESALPPAMAAAQAAWQDWRWRPVAERAAVLRRAADDLQTQLPHFCALLVKEAFKTWGDAVSEVREAIDFLRYYAQEAERIMQPMALPGPTGESNELRLVARGVWVCISPWNFPLAIFTGQVAAALATGNAVLAKPAEQTPGIALEAVRLLHRAGVPEGALQLLHGPGESVGASLVAAPGVAGVVFTGSTEVARHIYRALALKDGPIVPLIAETGGINAMLVDSSALPEQVADAVLQSAFRSAGQRCSALRLLCVHEGIADAVIAMVQGAAGELVLGDPADLATDVGPVIDAPARQNLQRQIDQLAAQARPLLGNTPIQPVQPVQPVQPAPLAAGMLAPAARALLLRPAAFEISSLAEVKEEVFGPVLQIMRWGSGDFKTPASVIQGINALGYGLTLGIQTRIDSRALALAGAAQVGNVYVNRNMIGAVVGSQPFGGEGLSGTGPKAGGPHYLYRFCAEQTLTINTTAAGGNAALLAAM